MVGSKTVLLVGGFAPGQSLWSIEQGFEAVGYKVVYVPSRGIIVASRESDIELASEEADRIPPVEDWDLGYADAGAYEEGLARLIQEHRPELMLWWFSKDDCPVGLITSLRQRFPWLKTVTHTQDDPWDALRHPEFSREFEFVATCCKQSVELYRERGLNPIVLYPPPARQLHGTAEPTRHEECDFSVTILSIYALSDSDGAAYLSSAIQSNGSLIPSVFPTNVRFATRWWPPLPILAALISTAGWVLVPSPVFLDLLIAAFAPIGNCPGFTRPLRSTSISTILPVPTAT